MVGLLTEGDLDRGPPPEPAKVTALMEQTGIVSSRRAAGLGDRQRQALTDALT